MSIAIRPSETHADQVACAHCGLPSPRPKIASEPTFCCSGCRGAYELIHQWGLEEYYQLSDFSGGEIGGDEAWSYGDLDDPGLLGRSAPEAMQSASGQRLLRVTLAISGLHCAACIWLIERAPERVAGWHSAHVSMHLQTIEVVFDPNLIRLSAIGGFLHRIGYQVSALGDRSESESDTEATRGVLIDVAIAGFCAANAMWIAVALYAGQFTGIAIAHAQFLRFAGVALGVAAVLFPGRVFFRSALASLRTRTPHMDLPVALGLTAGTAASVYALLDPLREVYFDSIACLVFFLLLGRWLQMRMQRRAGEAVETLVRFAPAVATRLDAASRPARVAVKDLSIGDLVRVGPGESVPIDGIVTGGESWVDRSLLTGESCPVRVGVGSQVEAGTDNIRANLMIRVEALSDETRLAAIQQAVSRAAESRTPIVQLANRIGAWFVIVVIVLASVTAIVWWSLDPTRIVDNVIALLIVACPCALALATPLAVAVSIGRLAGRNVLVRSGDCVERLKPPGTVFFDKTGTLTEGRMRVAAWHGSDDVLRDVAIIETGVHHPIAQAIVDYAFRNRASDDDFTDASAIGVENVPGRGVEGSIEGRHYRIGSPQMFDELVACPDPNWTRRICDILESGLSPIVVFQGDQCVAAVGVADPLRRDAHDVVRALRQGGWQVRIISGDHPSTVARVAASIGVEPGHAQGGLYPEDKLAAVQAAVGPVMMVGDGVNDAAALAAADVGVALRGGARASLAAAPVVIRDGKLKGVLELTRTARHTRRVIIRNFVISISYNVVAVALAMAGSITPLIAAALMPTSGLTVLGLTLASAKGDTRTP